MFVTNGRNTNNNNNEGRLSSTSKASSLRNNVGGSPASANAFAALQGCDSDSESDGESDGEDFENPLNGEIPESWKEQVEKGEASVYMETYVREENDKQIAVAIMENERMLSNNRQEDVKEGMKEDVNEDEDEDEDEGYIYPIEGTSGEGENNVSKVPSNWSAFTRSDYQKISNNNSDPFSEYLHKLVRESFNGDGVIRQAEKPIVEDTGIYFSLLVKKMNGKISQVLLAEIGFSIDTNGNTLYPTSALNESNAYNVISKFVAPPSELGKSIDDSIASAIGSKEKPNKFVQLFRQVVDKLKKKRVSSELSVKINQVVEYYSKNKQNLNVEEACSFLKGLTETVKIDISTERAKMASFEVANSCNQVIMKEILTLHKPDELMDLIKRIDVSDRYKLTAVIIDFIDSIFRVRVRKDNSTSIKVHSKLKLGDGNEDGSVILKETLNIFILELNRCCRKYLNEQQDRTNDLLLALMEVLVNCQGTEFTGIGNDLEFELLAKKYPYIIQKGMLGRNSLPNKDIKLHPEQLEFINSLKESFIDLQNTHWIENRLGNNKKAIVNCSPFAAGKTTSVVSVLDQCLQRYNDNNLVIVVAPSKALAMNFIVTTKSTSWIARTDGNGDMQVIVPKFVGRWPNYNMKSRNRRKLIPKWVKYNPKHSEGFNPNNYLDWEEYYLSWNTSSDKENLVKNKLFDSWVHEPRTELRDGYYRENVHKPQILFCDAASYHKIIGSFRGNLSKVKEDLGNVDKRRIFTVFDEAVATWDLNISFSENDLARCSFANMWNYSSSHNVIMSASINREEFDECEHFQHIEKEYVNPVKGCNSFLQMIENNDKDQTLNLFNCIDLDTFDSSVKCWMSTDTIIRMFTPEMVYSILRFLKEGGKEWEPLDIRFDVNTDCLSPSSFIDAVRHKLLNRLLEVDINDSLKKDLIEKRHHVRTIEIDDQDSITIAAENADQYILKHLNDHYYKGQSFSDKYNEAISTAKSKYNHYILEKEQMIRNIKNKSDDASQEEMVTKKEAGSGFDSRKEQKCELEAEVKDLKRKVNDLDFDVIFDTPFGSTTVDLNWWNHWILSTEKHKLTDDEAKLVLSGLEVPFYGKRAIYLMEASSNDDSRESPKKFVRNSRQDFMDVLNSYGLNNPKTLSVKILDRQSNPIMGLDTYTQALGRSGRPNDKNPVVTGSIDTGSKSVFKGLGNTSLQKIRSFVIPPEWLSKHQNSIENSNKMISVYKQLEEDYKSKISQDADRSVRRKIVKDTVVADETNLEDNNTSETDEDMDIDTYLEGINNGSISISLPVIPENTNISNIDDDDWHGFQKQDSEEDFDKPLGIDGEVNNESVPFISYANVLRTNDNSTISYTEEVREKVADDKVQMCEPVRPVPEPVRPVPEPVRSVCQPVRYRCTFWMLGKCKNSDATCRHAHDNNAPMKPFCEGWIRGTCDDKKCKDAHYGIAPNGSFTSRVCKSGSNCRKGNKCGFFHPN